MFGRKKTGPLRLGLGLCLVAVLLCTSASAWTIGGDTYAVRYDHPISGVPGAGTLAYPVLNFTVSNATGDPAGNIIYTDGTTQADWDDVRFTTSADAVLPCWIESTSASAAVFWVNVTSIPEAGTTLRIYYDSDTAQRVSNAGQTFLLGDDFGDGVISGWDTSKVTTATETGGNLTTTQTTDSWGDYTYGVSRAVSLPGNFEIVAKQYYPVSNPLMAEQYVYLIGATVYAGIFDNDAAAPGRFSTASGYTGSAKTEPFALVTTIRRIGSTVTYYEDGTVRSTASTAAALTAVRLTNTKYSTRSATPATWDYIRIRPLAVTEPVHGAYTEIATPPVAAFSADVTAGPAPLMVHFTDASTNTPTSWDWNWGDETAHGTTQNPTHQYATPGTYTVALTATNAGGSDSETKTGYITVAEPYVVPVADFALTPATGTVPFSVSSTIYSTGPPTAYAWDFDGDGSIDSTSPNASYEYGTPGTYTVTLTVTNPAGSDVVTKTDYISAYAVPVAVFSANVTSGYTPLAVAFTDASTGPPEEWAWTFAGPNEFYDLDLNQNPVLTLTEPGSYSVSLRASNPAGNDYENKTAYITVMALPAGPVASFTADAIAGHAPLLVSFTDTSAGSPTAWAWDFDGDAVADSTDQNPTYEYAADGNYTVTLQASNAGGTDLESKPEYVSVGPLTATYLKASFRFAVVGGSGGGGVAPLAVAFTDTTRTNGTYTRYWSFGDGETSVEANPTHVYTTAGKYDPRLTVESDTRRSTESYAKVIQAYPVAAASLLPTNTYGAKMTQMMDSNWNLSVIGPLLPTPYTDLVPETLFWGLLWGGVFMIYFVRQGTSWLTALLGIIIGGNVLAFLPPEWAAAGQALLIVSVGAFFYVLIQGRIRSS